MRDEQGTRPEMRDFLVTAQGESVRSEVTVRTWDGDGLDLFLDELAEGFRGWTGTRAWRSLATGGVSR